MNTKDSMKSSNTTRSLLTDQVLLNVFDCLSVVERKRVSRVCRRWKYLIHLTLNRVTVFSAVDDRRCVTDWEPAQWISLKFSDKKDYIRIPKISASDLLGRISNQLPNLNAIDLECCDMSTRILRSILDNCKKIERINLDSSTKLNYYSFNLITREWSKLRHINISCCTEVNELSASLIIRSLTYLESLNLCGTRINGKCLENLKPTMKRLDISYCWGVQEEGLMALTRANCKQLQELVVNNFDFDGSESCLVALCNTFKELKHLQMSIGPCVAHDYFIDRINTRGFDSIAALVNLETLIIEKICVLGNTSLLLILKQCKNIKYLKLNLAWLNMCTSLAFENIDKFLPELEELHILYPAFLKDDGVKSLSNLQNLRALTLTNADITNDIFKIIENLPNLVSINLDECRKITLRGLNQYCRIVGRRPRVKFNISLLGTGVAVSRLMIKRNFPPNLTGQVSHYRSTKNNLNLPPVINMSLR